MIVLLSQSGSQAKGLCRCSRGQPTRVRSRSVMPLVPSRPVGPSNSVFASLRLRAFASKSQKIAKRTHFSHPAAQMLPVVATPLPKMLPFKSLTLNDVTDVADFPTTYIEYINHALPVLHSRLPFRKTAVTSGRLRKPTEDPPGGGYLHCRSVFASLCPLPPAAPTCPPKPWRRGKSRFAGTKAGCGYSFRKATEAYGSPPRGVLRIRDRWKR